MTGRQEASQTIDRTVWYISLLTRFRNPMEDGGCIVYSVYVILLSCGIYYLYLLLSQIVRDLVSSTAAPS